MARDRVESTDERARRVHGGKDEARSRRRIAGDSHRLPRDGQKSRLVVAPVLDVPGEYRNAISGGRTFAGNGCSAQIARLGNTPGGAGGVERSLLPNVPKPGEKHRALRQRHRMTLDDLDTVEGRARRRQKTLVDCKNRFADD